MIRSSVDLPQPDGPISETNSPWAMSRSIPSSAVVTGSVAAGEDLVDAGEVDDGRVVGHAGVGSCDDSADRSDCRGRPAAQDEPPAATMSDEERRSPSRPVPPIAAQSFSGPVM